MARGLWTFRGRQEQQGAARNSQEQPGDTQEHPGANRSTQEHAGAPSSSQKQPGDTQEHPGNTQDHPGAPRKHPGAPSSAQETSRRHLRGTQEAPRRHPVAPRRHPGGTQEAPSRTKSSRDDLGVIYAKTIVFYHISWHGRPFRVYMSDMTLTVPAPAHRNEPPRSANAVSHLARPLWTVRAPKAKDYFGNHD